MEPARVIPDSWLTMVAKQLDCRFDELDRQVRGNSQLAEACMDYAECLLALNESKRKSPATLARIQEYRFLEKSIKAELLEMLSPPLHKPTNS